MQREFHNISQNSDEWLALRLGKFTASTFADLFMGKSTIGYKKATYKPAFERIAGEAPESFYSDYMARGHELEPLAVDQYESTTFTPTSNGGFWTMGEWVGASPDRMVASDGILEIKCPAFHTHIDYLLGGKLPTTYKYQVHGQLYVTDRDWCDFYSYHPNLPAFCIRVHRDLEMDKEIQRQLDAAISAAQTVLTKLERVAA